MVIRASSVGLMHILTRRSLLKLGSQALAWQTTSRSKGLVNIERSQKVWGSGSNPSEVKKASPILTIFFESYFCRLISEVTSRVDSPLKGSTRGMMFPHSWAHMFPRRWAGIGPSGGTL